MQLSMVSNWKQNIEEILNELYALSHSTIHLSASCPNYPKQQIVPADEIVIFVFDRHLRRAIYFARLFVEQIDKISKMIKSDLQTKEGYGVSISENLFHCFDAFVIGLKSIMGKKVAAKMAKTMPDYKSDILSIAIHAANTYITPYLDVLRNEVVHLNNRGSCRGNFAHIDFVDEIPEIKILSDFTLNGQNLDIVELFTFILRSTSETIRKLYSIFFRMQFDKYGKPEKLSKLKVADHILSYEKYIEL